MNNIFQAALEFSPIGILIFDNSKRVAFSNQKAMKLFGFSWKEFKSISFESLFCHPDKSDSEPLNFTFREGGDKETEEFNLLGKRKGGAFFPVKVLIVFLELGSENFSIACLNEAAPAKCHESMMLSSIFQESANGIYLIDNDSLRFLNANREALQKVGYTLGEIEHLSPWDLIPDFDGQTFRKHLDPLLKGEAAKVIFESEIKRKVSGTYPAEIHLQLIKEGNSNIVMQTVVDLSAKRRGEREHLNRLIQAQDAERERIAKELHDDLGQYLTAIQLNINALEQHFENQSNLDPKEIFSKLNSIVQNTIVGLKTISRDLMPNVLMDFGLVKGLHYLCDNFNSPQLHVNLQVFNMEQDLEPPVEMALYRITQELLNNAVKHGNAKEINVQMINNGRSVVLTVEDDGIGFNTNTSPNRGGLGIKNIQSRIIALGGNYSFDSIKGYGSSVLVEVPLNPHI
jgi:PAS domain S-box-containing protein